MTAADAPEVSTCSSCAPAIPERTWPDGTKAVVRAPHYAGVPGATTRFSEGKVHGDDAALAVMLSKVVYTVGEGGMRLVPLLKAATSGGGDLWLRIVKPRAVAQAFVELSGTKLCYVLPGAAAGDLRIISVADGVEDYSAIARQLYDSVVEQVWFEDGLNSERPTVREFIRCSARSPRLVAHALLDFDFETQYNASALTAAMFKRMDELLGAAEAKMRDITEPWEELEPAKERSKARALAELSSATAAMYKASRAMSDAAAAAKKAAAHVIREA